MRVVYEPKRVPVPSPPAHYLAADYRPGTIVEHEDALWIVEVDGRDHDLYWALFTGEVPS